MAAKMQTPQGRAVYNQRMHIAETPFAIIKNVLGVRQFLLRSRNGRLGKAGGIREPNCRNRGGLTAHRAIPRYFGKTGSDVAVVL
jgi:hypothetical protein